MRHTSLLYKDRERRETGLVTTKVRDNTVDTRWIRGSLADSIEIIDQDPSEIRALAVRVNAWRTSRFDNRTLISTLLLKDITLRREKI